jgi:hypothetical protein
LEICPDGNLPPYPGAEEQKTKEGAIKGYRKKGSSGGGNGPTVSADHNLFPNSRKEIKMKSRILISISAFTLLAALASPVRLAAQGNREGKPTKLVIFDAPGAGTGAFEGTVGYGINPAGAIVGVYADTSNVGHGFLRARDGTFTTFDAPGSGGSNVLGTAAYNINPQGAIAGVVVDNNNVSHGFLRAPNGAITIFDAPGAGTASNQGTLVGYPDCLNPAGAIAGAYQDAGSVLQPYVRATDGTITDFNVSGAGTGSGQGTHNIGINPAGTVQGYYTDSSGVNHGYLRTADGTIIKYDVPGAGKGSGQGTLGGCINPAGTIAGDYLDANNVYHGYVRASKGDITKIDDVPGAGTRPFQGTVAFCNNPANAISGFYLDANNVAHGFLLVP